MDFIPYYEEAGTGDALILLHGNGEDHTYFTHQIAFFSKKYRVIALDTRGHGNSLRGAGPFTLSRFADDLKAFMDARGLKNAILLGFSDGGNIALLFALRYPARVRSLIISGANLDPKGICFAAQLPVALGYAAAWIAALFTPKARPKKEMLGLMVWEPHIDPKQLRLIRQPVLVLAGTRDLVRIGHTRLIARSLPNSNLVLIPGNHFVARENPVKFNDAVAQFLEKRFPPV